MQQIGVPRTSVYIESQSLLLLKSRPVCQIIHPGVVPALNSLITCQKRYYTRLSKV